MRVDPQITAMLNSGESEDVALAIGILLNDYTRSEISMYIHTYIPNIMFLNWIVYRRSTSEYLYTSSYKKWFTYKTDTQ